MANWVFIQKQNNSSMLTHRHGTGKLILVTLAEEPGLNTKQLYHRILRQSEKTISYQAVHKKIRVMEKEGIISKNAHAFRISESWLNEVTNIVTAAKLKSSDVSMPITDLSSIHQIRTHYEIKLKEDTQN